MDRRRRRVERVGELVEEIFWAATTGDDSAWKHARNRPGQALVGLHKELPQCAQVLTMHLAPSAQGAASLARIEIERALQVIGENQE
ncbi:MAG: hypothetical protein M3Y33_19055 [Actinomycetota bacterium]|nr:hypothetical protein [Actinomycetota bacterium]